MKAIYRLIFILLSIGVVFAQVKCGSCIKNMDKWICTGCESSMKQHIVEPPTTPQPTQQPTQQQLKQYCPKANDFIIAYSTPGSSTKLIDGGWETRGGAGVATKAAYNLLGGWVEYEVDFSGTNIGVNANIYTLSPKITGTDFSQKDYCDAQKNGDAWCAEIDWVETNGRCGGATTYHMVRGAGIGCTAWGCHATYKYGSATKFNMRIEYTKDGIIRTYRNGELLTIKPPPTDDDWDVVKQQYTDRGAVIYSSQWVGWVPMAECSGGQTKGNANDLATSTYSIKKLKIMGSIVKGSSAALC